MQTAQSWILPLKRSSSTPTTHFWKKSGTCNSSAACVLPPPPAALSAVSVIKGENQVNCIERAFNSRLAAQGVDVFLFHVLVWSHLCVLCVKVRKEI